MNSSLAQPSGLAQTAQELARPAHYFPALTGVRTLAAYLVYLHHFNPFVAHSLEKNTMGFYAFAFCGELHVGVTVFFCLSGFLIAHRYLHRVEFSQRWFFAYFRNRFARIYPMYFLLTILVFAIWFYDPHSIYVGPYNVFSGQREALLVLGLNLTFLRGFSSWLKFTGVAQGWSLTVEETFYLMAPLILWWVASRPKRLWLVAGALMLGGLLLVLAFVHKPVLDMLNNYPFMWSYTFFGRCFEFLAGIFLASLLQARQNQLRNRVATWPVMTWTGALLVVLCVVLLVIAQGKYERIIVNNVFLAVAILLFFYGLLTESTLVQRLFASAPMQLLGKSSYVFYLIHVGTISIWLNQFFPALSLWKFLALNAIAVALYKLIEEPVNDFLRRRLAR